MLVLWAVLFLGGGLGAILGAALSQNWNGPPLIFGVFWLAGGGGYWLWLLSFPHTISLSSNGMIEFKSILRRRSVQAFDVKSVKPEWYAYGFLLVRTDQRTITLFAQFDGFHEFLTKLKALNPRVELRGC
jgi:hypothetical protein